MTRTPAVLSIAVLLLPVTFVHACARDSGGAAPRDLETLRRWLTEADELERRADRESCRRAAALDLEAVELAQELDRPLWEAAAHQRLGKIHRDCLEEPREAMGHYLRALPIYEELGRIDDQSTVLNQIGWLHWTLGEADRALELCDRALELARRRGNRRSQAAILNVQAIIARHRGEAQRVLTLYEQAIELLEDLDAVDPDDPVTGLDLAQALHNRGRLYQALGQHRPALADLDRSRAVAHESEASRLLSMVLTRIGRIRMREGNLDGALEALEEARRLRRTTGQEHGHAVTLLELAAVSEKLGRPDRATELNRQALSIFRRKEAPRESARAQTALGRLETAAGRPGEALRRLDEALRVFRELRDPSGESETLLALAHAERARERPAAALEHVRAAIARLEEVRSRSATHDLRRAFVAAHREVYDLHLDLLMELHRRDPSAGYDLRALEAAERSRARSLVELLTENRDALLADADPELLALERELEDRLAVLDQERLEPPDEGETRAPEEIAALEARLDEVLRRLRAVRGRILAESPKVAALARPPGFGVRELQTRALDEETLLLEIHLGAERSFLWAVTPDSVASFELPPRAEIEEAARTAHELLPKSHQRRYRVTAALALERLGRLILDPVAGLLKDKRLLIAADGALHYIPFGALPIPGVSPAAPLIASHEVVHVPSASALIVLREQRADPERRPADGLLAVIADPVFDADDPRLTGHETTAETEDVGDRLGPLRFSRVEAEAILGLAGTERTRQALGFEATRETLIDPALGRYRIVHLSTHGRIDTERPELSELVFSRFDRRGRPRKGVLRAHEIFDLELSAELVVLSACETALGEEVRGEGLVGLTQGFFSAGAAGVVVSLWQVDDRATARLMERFYRHLFAGRSPATSLREAQLSLREEVGWQAPFYWAGFVVQGEWRQTLGVRHPS